MRTQTAQSGDTAKQSKRNHYPVKKVVIVDDSRTIRAWLRWVLEKDQRLHIVGEAGSAAEARRVIRDTSPDVITLDIEMPGMSGLDFLRKIMDLHPVPVVMVSCATEINSEATITALSLGAVDCLLKPTSLADEESQRTIIRRVFSAACSKVQMRRRPAPAEVSVLAPSKGPHPVILIGASTGGVAALEHLLSDLPANAPPIVIVQHMPGPFLMSFSRMLNQKLPHDVCLAREDEVLGPGQVRLAPEQGFDTVVARRPGGWVCRFQDRLPDARHCPSVDALFMSAVKSAQDVIAVILTGLGRDGAQGLGRLRAGGALTLGQDAQSSVVYGMPRAAFEAGAVVRQYPLDDLGKAVVDGLAAHAKMAARSARS